MSDPDARLHAALADRYAIQRELGRGGMATVYLADDLRHHRPVAIKVLKPELATALGPDRFLREIEVTAQLHHPMILPLLDSGEADGTLFYVMPFVEGESLRDRLEREWQLPLEDALQITKDVAEALGYAHRRGVIHRDIKPENILLESGHALVADFGIAKAVTEAGGERLTGTGVSIGTPAYMSPEQASGDPNVDGRSDLYSLACVLYETLSGEPPFAGPNPQAILSKKLTETTPRLSVLRERVPDSVEAALYCALAKAPADRQATVERFVEDFATPPVASRRPGGRRRGLALLGAAVTVAAAGAVWLGMREPARTLDPNLVVVLPFRAIGLPAEYESFGLGIGVLAEALLNGDGGPRAVSSSTVRSFWERAGGAKDNDLPEERAIELASVLGAGRLITGSFVGAGDSVQVVATLTRTGDDASRQPVRASGAVTSIPDLIEQVLGQLLALEAGIERRSLASLTTTSIGALQAFLEGMDLFYAGDGRGAIVHFGQALDQDSTFALAGLWYSVAAVWANEPARRGFEVATAHRNRLSQADRLVLDAWLGSLAELEELVRRLPDRPEAWFLYGDGLYHNGLLLGIPDALARADSAFDSARRLSSAWAVSPYVHVHQLEFAALRRDTSRYRGLWEPLRDASDSLGARWYWGAATMFEDSTALAFWRASMPTLPDLDLLQIAVTAKSSEMGFADAIEALRILRSRGWPENDPLVVNTWLYRLLMELGRPQAAAEYVRPFVIQGTPPSILAESVLWKLLADGDTVLAQEAAGHLRRIRDESPPPSDRRSEWLWGNLALALWQLDKGDERGARETLAAIGADDSGDALQAVCEGIVEAGLAPLGDQLPILIALDSIVTSSSIAYRWLSASRLSMVLATAFEQHGEYDRALKAVTRYVTGMGDRLPFLAARYRREGHLALAIGDTARAIDAFERYLRFRHAPEPELQAEANEVRAQLAALVAR